MIYKAQLKFNTFLKFSNNIQIKKYKNFTNSIILILYLNDGFVLN